MLEKDFVSYLKKYLEWMKIQNFSERTIENRELMLGYFIIWASDRGLMFPRDITKAIVDRYQRYIYHYRKKNGDPLSFSGQHAKLTPVRAFFKWLSKNNYILYNPASEMELPKLEKRLPKYILSVSEVEQIVNQCNVEDPLGMRDRAIIELLYSTGMRRMEAIHLKIQDLDMDRGTVMVRQGKGRKDRVIPIGDRAIAWISKYLDDARYQFAIEPDDGTLFLTHKGEVITSNRFTQMVRDYVNGAEIGKKGSCHLFRHTMATLMLENGADIRFIQAMLGHARLETTEIYTQVSIRKLKEIHTATHPGKLEHSKLAIA
jgi:integrase/recombinase XerD